MLAGGTDAAQRVALVATEPLTQHEEWINLPVEEVVVFRKGDRIM